MHQVMFLFSDRGTPMSARFMNGYGSHTYSLWNAKGERFWVKFHFKTQQGIKNFTDEEAARWPAMTPTTPPVTCSLPSRPATSRSGRCAIQVMPEADAET